MFVTLLFGPGEAEKRNQLQVLKKKYSQSSIFTIDLKQQSLADLEMSLNSRSLFDSEERLVVLENPGKTLDLKQLLSSGEKVGVELVIVAPALEAGSLLLKTAKEVGVKLVNFEAERESSAFPFLDKLIEGKKEAFLELDKILAQFGGMYVLTMIYYLFRRNILPSPPSVFVQNKINAQKKNYQLADWQKLYYLVLKTESDIKSGMMEEKLALTLLVERIIDKDFKRVKI